MNRSSASVKQRVPKCPTLRLHRHAGEERASECPASESWLKGGKRMLFSLPDPRCGRKPATKGSQPKPGQKYPTEEPALPD